MSAPLLAAKLVELRQQRGCSQQEIADYLGVTREAYSHYERNTREPNLEIILKLTKFYQIEVSKLINENTIPIQSDITTGVVTTRISCLPSGAFGMANGKSMLSYNMNHFLKLFTGKNTALDLTTVTKEDISVLAQYKLLDKQTQKEVKDFIKFKHTLTKKKK